MNTDSGFLVLVCGASGVGKTSLIASLRKEGSIEVINTDVAGRKRTVVEPGRTTISEKAFRRNEQAGMYSVVHEYEGSQYGSILPEASGVRRIWDYPGEYPECSELSRWKWRGILCLPPNVGTLVRRLLRSGRAERVSSAIEEYEFCLSLISEGRLSNSWRTIVLLEGQRDRNREVFMQSIESFES